jgi:hypothetical protein
MELDTWHTSDGPSTCARCRALDGTRWPAGVGPVPPLHPNCRCRRVGPGGQSIRNTEPDPIVSPIDRIKAGLAGRKQPDPRREKGSAG